MHTVYQEPGVSVFSGLHSLHRISRCDKCIVMKTMRSKIDALPEVVMEFASYVSLSGQASNRRGNSTVLAIAVCPHSKVSGSLRCIATMGSSQPR